MTEDIKLRADELDRFVNERISDLQMANEILFGLDRDTVRDRERNDREISWLNDLVETINTAEWSFSGFGEKWQADAEKYLRFSRSPVPATRDGAD